MIMDLTTNFLLQATRVLHVGNYDEKVDALISIYEEREEYEKCELLKYKKEDSVIIMESKTI